MVSFEFYVLAALVLIGGVISIVVSYSVEKKNKTVNMVIARMCDIQFNAIYKELDELREELNKLKGDKQAHG